LHSMAFMAKAEHIDRKIVSIHLLQQAQWQQLKKQWLLVLKR